jgi:hypothetical protein
MRLRYDDFKQSMRLGPSIRETAAHCVLIHPSPMMLHAQPIAAAQ